MYISRRRAHQLVRWVALGSSPVFHIHNSGSCYCAHGIRTGLTFWHDQTALADVLV